MTKRRRRIDPNTVVLLKHVGVGVLMVGTLALIIYGVWHGSRWEKVTIVDVEVKGGETINLAVLRDLAQVELEGDYLGLIPKRFSWMYPKSNILETVSKVDRVKDVSVVRDGGTKILIEFTEHKPFALWCSAVGPCYFIDEEGLAFSQSPDLSGGSFLRIVTAGRDPEQFEVVATEIPLNNVVKLTELFAEQDWYISQVELDQVGDAFLTVVGGGELKVALGNSPYQIVEDFLVVLSSEEFSHLEPGNFQYLDLRFIDRGGKIYVNEELVVPETSTTSVSSTTVNTHSSSSADLQ